MLSRILRSPLVPMSFLFIVVLAFYVIQQNREGHLNSAGSSILTIVMVVLLVIWFTLVSLHNRKNPRDKINMLGLIPMEFRESDEGQQWITYKACRNVYIYYNAAVPFAIVLNVLSPWASSNGLFLLAALGFGQYIVYGLTISKLNRA